MAQEYNPIPPAPEPPRRRNTTLIVAIIALVILCCCCTALGVLYQYGDALILMMEDLAYLPQKLAVV